MTDAEFARDAIKRLRWEVDSSAKSPDYPYCRVDRFDLYEALRAYMEKFPDEAVQSQRSSKL